MSINSKIIDSFAGLNVLVIGDVMLDRYLFGQIDRISPEAPIPIVDLEKTESRLGGAANVALSIKALGANPILLSVVGRDHRGIEIIKILSDLEIENGYLLQSEERPTTVKSRILASSQQVLRIDDESKEELSKNEEETIVAQMRQIFNNFKIDSILLQDYNKGVLTNNFIDEVILEAIRMDIPVAVDPKFKNFWSYKKVHLFKPNLEEVRRSLPFSIDSSIESLNEASRFIKKKLGNKITMITLSDKGVYIDDGNNQTISPTTPRKISDVCGAGDAVISISTLAIALELSIEEIGLMANLAGGQICEKVGVVALDSKQLRAELDKINHQITIDS